jgi:methionyl-tRNA formyltransferase
MILKGVLFLGGFTARSQAYAQAMVKEDLTPEYSLIFGPKKASLPGQADNLDFAKVRSSIFLPDLNIPLRKTFLDKGWNYEKLGNSNINEDEIEQAIKEKSPSLIIYSGYGSQIVSEKLLNIEIPFLHLHSGWLPEYRGSTTMYYSWLKEGACGVTAIYLHSGIDTGQIISQKNYPTPPDGIDPDYIYDCAIRADLLVSVLKTFAENKGYLKPVEQGKEGDTYYVIHPVLKHLARLSTT